MNEQLPTPNTAQDQLFNPDQFDPAVQAERQSLAKGLLTTISTMPAEQLPPVEAPMSQRETQAHVDALTELITTEDVPEHVTLKRDWSDTLAQHQEKQAEHVEAVKATLSSRLADNVAIHTKQAKKVAAQEKRAANRVQKAEEAAADHAIKTEYDQKIDAYNEQLAQRDAIKAERQAAKDEYISRQQLLRGQNQAKLFKAEIAAEAEQYATEKLGAEPIDPNVVDTAKLKEQRVAAQQTDAEETAEARKDFQKRFVDKNALELEDFQIPEFEPGKKPVAREASDGSFADWEDEVISWNEPSEEDNPTVQLDTEAEVLPETPATMPLEYEDETVEQPAVRKSVWQRAQDAFYGRLYKVQAAMGNTFEKARRHPKAAAALGVLTVGLAAGGVKYGLTTLEHSHSAVEAAGTVPMPSNSSNHLPALTETARWLPKSSLGADQVASSHAMSAAQTAHEHAQHASHVVQTGQNPWTISQHHLTANGYPHPTPAQIAHYDHLIQQANGLDETTSKTIQVGTRLTMPRIN